MHGATKSSTGCRQVGKPSHSGVSGIAVFCQLFRMKKSSRPSHCVRIVIARHSPKWVFESGLLAEAPEKSRCDESKAAPNVISLVRFVKQISRKAGPLRYFTPFVTEFLCS